MIFVILGVFYRKGLKSKTGKLISTVSISKWNLHLLHFVNATTSRHHV